MLSLEAWNMIVLVEKYLDQRKWLEECQAACASAVREGADRNTIDRKYDAVKIARYELRKLEEEIEKAVSR